MNIEKGKQTTLWGVICYILYYFLTKCVLYFIQKYICIWVSKADVWGDL